MKFIDERGEAILALDHLGSRWQETSRKGQGSIAEMVS